MMTMIPSYMPIEVGQKNNQYMFYTGGPTLQLRHTLCALKYPIQLKCLPLTSDQARYLANELCNKRVLQHSCDRYFLFVVFARPSCKQWSLSEGSV